MLNYQTDRTEYREDDPYIVCRDESKGPFLDKKAFMQWLADKFKIHEELDPLTMDGLRDYWKKLLTGMKLAKQSSSHECHASDPPEAAYYNKSNDPDEEYIARRLQIVKKVNFDLEFSIWLEENFLDPKNIDQDTRNALSKQKDICNEINRKDRTIENDENVFDSFSHLYENVFG
ncbi:hypothetical protein Tco_0005662 [Tanacetum coccineum]